MVRVHLNTSVALFLPCFSFLAMKLQQFPNARIIIHIDENIPLERAYDAAIHNTIDNIEEKKVPNDEYCVFVPWLPTSIIYL
mmetsp:Transcript_16090/g.33787  ORF Transcript_16090/g.33787 Transcript_16090/m.33787 type:complete len:82 (+) Transcript_16090:752-997(+)